MLRSLLLVAGFVFPLQAGAAQPVRDSVRLRELVVSATREQVPARVRATPADLVGAAEMRRRQVTRLADALRLLPSVTMVGTGATGGTTSTFFRGVNSNQTLLLIDGIRVNDANAVPGALLGGFEFLPGDRVEVARGPQSNSFGGAAIGGVIAVAGVDEQVGSTAGATTEAGGFGTYRGQVSGSTAAGRLSLSAGGAFIDTDNQRPSNQYDQRTEQLRLRLAAGRGLTVGATFRGLQQTFASPGDIRTTNTTPEGTTRFDHTLATVFVEGRPSGTWSSRLTLGGQDYFLEGTSRFNGGDPFVSHLESRRWVADWQHRLAVSGTIGLTGGINAEWTDVTGNDGSREEQLRAGYAQATITPTENLLLSAGGRFDDYSTFGSRVTGRVAVGYFFAPASLKVRGTFGTGFMPPSLAARYGGAFQRANPDLRPERSRGFDLGVDRFFAAGRGMASVTYFRNELTDLIGFEAAAFPDLGRGINIARATTEGLEMAVRVETGTIDARASYTLLSAEDGTAATDRERRLIRRPRHALAADVAWQPNRFVIGGGVAAALDREDTDFNVFPFARLNPGDYLDARLYGEVRAGGGLAVRARLENLFDTRYEEAYGFPALGRRLVVGVAIDWLR